MLKPVLGIILFLTFELEVRGANCEVYKNIRVGFVKAYMSISYFTTDEGSKIYYGPDVGFLNYLEQALNWKLQLIETLDNTWGNRANDTFDGAFGILLNGQVELVIPLSMSEERSQVMDFSYPTIINPLALLSHKPSYLPKFYALTWPFSYNLWIATLLSYFTFSATFYLIIKLADRIMEGPKEEHFGLYKCLTVVYKSYFHTSVFDRYLPVKRAPKLLILIWISMIFILSKAYSSSLISNLTYPATQKPIDTFNQLITAKERSVVFLKETFHRDFFKTSRDFELKDIYKKFTDGGSQMVSFTKMKEALLKNTRIVIPVSKNVNQDTTVISWGLPLGQTFAYWSKEELYSTGAGLGFAKGSKMGDCVNTWITRAWDFGLHSKWRLDGNRAARFNHPIFKNKKERSKMKDILLSLPSKSDSNQPLSIAQLQSAYYICFFMNTIALIAFVTEIWLHRRAPRWKIRHNI